MSYKKFLYVLLLVVFLGFISASGSLAQQVPLPGNKIAQFVDPLPLLSVSGGSMETIVDGGTQITLTMKEFKANVMPTGFLPANGLPYTGTWVWGYRDVLPTGTQETYIGPVIVATRGSPTEIKYMNNLGNTATTNLTFWKTSTDQTLHWANPNNLAMFMGMCNIPPIATDPPQCFNYTGPIPAVPHLHGGEVPPVLDGGPDAWFLSDAYNSTDFPSYSAHGAAFYSKDDPGNNFSNNWAIYRYPNKQEAAMIWFHDHLLGATRLNVYAGIAGAYALIDTNLKLPTGLHPVGLQQGTDASTVEYLIPLVIQDRMFDTNGQLFFPNIGINPEHPFWLPEFVGDTIVVNGKVWPFQNVDRKRYRFLFLNGSNARAYDMFLIDPVSGVKGPRMWVIGTDGGYLDSPVLIDPNSVTKTTPKSLVMMPGERYDVIIDFNDPVWIGLINAAYPAGVPNPLNQILRNRARTPFPGGAPAPVNTTGRIMQFSVSATAPTDNSYDPSGGVPLRTGTNSPNFDNQKIVRLVDPVTGTSLVIPDKTRQLTLNEVMGPGGPLEILVNNTKWSGKQPDGNYVLGSPIQVDIAGNQFTEYPDEGTTEVWEIINLTADAHPIHTHLTQFQLINRQDFNVKGYNAAYALAFPGSATIIDPMTGLPYSPNVYIPAFGPPNNYNTPNAAGAIGGNPDVTPFLAAKKGIQIITPPQPWERGWKDTVIMYPGQVTRIAVRYAPTDIPVGGTGGDPTTLYYPFDPNALFRDYVWHCHIIDHEDNEMMRPFQVSPKLGVTRTYELGTDY